jgi:hypothetical protein
MHGRTGCAATHESRVRFIAGGLTVCVVLGGCGSSAPKPDPARVARVVAETNAACSSILHRSHPSTTQQLETQHRLAVLVKTLSQAAAYLPAGRSLNEAHAKRRALEIETSKAGKSGVFVTSKPKVIERFHRLEAQIHNDYKALGVTRCLERPLRPPISG